MQNKIQQIMYGGDYNPNQWPRETWNEDITFFKDASINTATINVFSWASLQPNEDTYDFSELDEIVKMLSDENFNIIMATSTAALPAWLVKKYPEVARTDYNGIHKKFGKRHNACPNSPVFKRFSEKLAFKLAERYKDNPHIVCWHIGMIPALDASGRPCMYDTVTKQPFYNIGTGEFLYELA